MSKRMLKKLLIFGSGFMSRFIASAAQDNGIEPIVLYNRHPLEDMDEVVQVRLSSCDMKSFLKDTRPSYIISLQGSSFVPDNRHIVESLNANLMMTILFMEQVMALVQEGKISPDKIILVGSAAEYGRTHLEPITETFPLHPTSIYGLTKIFLFNASRYYFERGLPIVYTRQFNCTGPYQRADFVIPSICRQIALIEKQQKDSISIGDTSQERDFIDVRDAAQAYLVLLKKAIVGEVYNVGSGYAVSVSDVLNKAISFARSNTKIITRTNNQLFFNKNELSNMICANVIKLSALGFKPQFRLDDTIHDVIEFWRKRV
jgi:GDP-4-dehydro-6-deoxy-D-mannose reductase